MSSPHINYAKEKIEILAVVLMHDLRQIANDYGLNIFTAYEIFQKEIERMRKEK